MPAMGARILIVEDDERMPGVHQPHKDSANGAS